MERQLIEDYLNPIKNGYRSLRKELEGGNIHASLDVATKTGLIRVSGLVHLLNYPGYVLIMPVDEQNFTTLLEHPNRSKKYFFHYDLEGIEVGLHKGIRRAMVHFVHPYHAIKTLSFDENLVYSAPFIGEEGIYKLKGKDKINAVNELRKSIGFPEHNVY